MNDPIYRAFEFTDEQRLVLAIAKDIMVFYKKKDAIIRKLLKCLNKVATVAFKKRVVSDDYLMYFVAISIDSLRSGGSKFKLTPAEKSSGEEYNEINSLDKFCDDLVLSDHADTQTFLIYLTQHLVEILYDKRKGWDTEDTDRLLIAMTGPIDEDSMDMGLFIHKLEHVIDDKVDELGKADE